jgi:hypothetical protein
MDRFAATGNNDARAQALNSVWPRNRSSQMHQKGNRTHDTGGVVNQLNEFARGCPASEIDDSGQWRMVMSTFAYLDKIYTTFKMVHHLLPTPPVPPFNCEIVFSTGTNDPIRLATFQWFGQWHRIPFLFRGQMDVSMESGRLKADVQLSAQVPDIAMDKMVGKLVALMNQRIMTLHDSRLGIVIGDAHEKRVMLPQRGTRRAHVSGEPARMLFVKSADRGRQHEHVAGRKSAMEEEFFHAIRVQE